MKNSPKNHAEIEALMADKASTPAWKGTVVVRRCMYSISKCGNLNMASDLIDTEIARLNDADTMLKCDCMVHASIWTKDKGHDIVQSMNVHRNADCRGRPGEAGQERCYPQGVLLTIGDCTKPPDISSRNMRGHSPFNERGGFWRISALKKVQFDRHTSGRIVVQHTVASHTMGAKEFLTTTCFAKSRKPMTVIIL